MSAESLYDCTRGCWKNGIGYAEQADYVLSFVDGIVFEVYEVQRWMLT